ncbi:MAG: SIMPL domain-containing protein [Nitrososphaera sp.]|jgi:uncharacterized protein YggE
MQISRQRVLIALLAAGIVAGVSAISFWSAGPTVASAQSLNGSQAAPGATGNLGNHTKATVSTSGTATSKIKPDKFSVTLAVETNGTTAEAAEGDNANASARVISAVEALGIPQSQISTNSYTISPVYAQSQTPGGQCPAISPAPPGCQQGSSITGYIAVNALTVTLDTAGAVDAGKLIDTAVHAGANSITQVTFFLSDEKQQQVRDSLIQDAISNARHSADVAAKAVGMTVSGVQSIVMSESPFPAYSLAPEAAASANTQILPGQQDVTMTVEVVYYIS